MISHLWCRLILSFHSKVGSCGANSVKQEKGMMTEQYIAGTIGILGVGWLGLPLAA
ncbi:hypothetical protein AERO9A_240056 [Aeromonas salmonicida]|nr:hypothetical protein AERO9A_240056 [Aeromonas salmonicida]